MAKWIVSLIALSVAACTTGGGLFGGRSAPAGSPTARASGGNDASGIDARGLGVYLELMRSLIEGDTVTQAEAFSAAADAADFAPTTTNRLEYALALSVPGHAGSNPTLAEQHLSALLSAGDALLPEERVLATIQLRDVEQRLILDAAAEQLRRESAAALEQQDAASSERLQTALEENHRLRAELEDATEKLNAITTIEQSIRERENGPN